MDSDSKVHIFGASGSGTTTLGSELGRQLGIRHLDTDNYYWKLTDPPFVEKNPPNDRVAQIQLETDRLDGWILSGSLCSWGDPLLKNLTLAIFLVLDPSIRMERLRLREIERYGNRINPDGDMHQQHLEFLDWAASYDTAKSPVRSMDLHRRWMVQLCCPILTLDSAYSVDELINQIRSAPA